jgi:hypothetical protein
MGNSDIDHAFSPSRQAMVQDFVDVIRTSNVDDFREAWRRHADVLEGARGLFVVDNPVYEVSLPGNQDFGETGFLRNIMANSRLALIQSESFGFEFSNSPVIFADTNFVSLCEAFYAGRDLGGHTDAFRQAIGFLDPFKLTTNPYPYLLENAEHPNKEKIRSTLIAFAAFKVSHPTWPANGSSYSGSISELEKLVDEQFLTMDGSDFRAVHSLAKHHFLWARVILLKSALIVFEKPASNASSRFYALLEFLHERLA